MTRKFARHSDVQTAARVYSHLTQDDVDAGMAKLPGNGMNGAQAQDGVTALAEALRTLTLEQSKAPAEALLSEV